ncbi:hypothetical protein FQV39_30080 (plasmid) [Bosea sp. F3-2]|uniref:hypothetical protein n=1 Tax=Bosea sp. F3-2 TaxID=2599640 RepID=UPI0011EFA183|nr:hypothetical protein [Bosea sp. F3-2]QEL26910.1 hypothetical protein FQV39_30080 [Bosea sp. F3-2]
MAVFQYTWGIERPREKKQRHLRNATVLREAALEVARREYEARLAQIEADAMEERRLLELVELSTPGGRYDSTTALQVAAQFGVLPEEGQSVARRGPGRPRKYQPGDPRPPRPSRAKTRAGRLRAKAMRLAKLNAPVLVSPVTASPARAIAPKAAAEIGRALLTGTIAAQQDVVAPIEVDVVVADGALVAEPMASSAPAVLDFAAIAARHQASLQRAAEELAGDELSEDGAFLRSTILRSHRMQNQEFVLWERGQDGARKLPYDFSDAMDEARAAPEVRALFKGFGLSRHIPSSEMSEGEMQAWMQRTIFDDEDSPKADFDRYVKECGSCMGFYQRYKRTFEPEIERERLRVAVWPAIERRLHYVERTYDLMMRGEVDRDTAMVRVASLDCDILDHLLTSSHGVYREIVDAMVWFEGFSRLDIAEWSGHDPSKVPLCKVKQGFPGWSYPKRLHEEILGRYMIEEAWADKYELPDLAELAQFASTDRELFIANLRLRTDIDYSDIDL